MAVLTTRVLIYPDENGDQKELVLTVFMPFETEAGDWRCRFAFNPPIVGRVVDAGGVDFLQAFVGSLSLAYVYLKTTNLFGRTHWQGMLDCGLPESVEGLVALNTAGIQPPDSNAGSMDVLTTRRLGYPDESGVEREILLTVFMPFKEGEMWKCGFTFGLPESGLVRYGVGEDFIEALLDGLAAARVASEGFEGKVPEGRETSGELLDCTDFPYKVGRSFRTNRAQPTTATGPA